MVHGNVYASFSHVSRIFSHVFLMLFPLLLHPTGSSHWLIPLGHSTSLSKTENPKGSSHWLVPLALSAGSSH